MNPYLRLLTANKGRGTFRAEGNVIWLYDVIVTDKAEAEWFGGIAAEDFIAQLQSMSGPVTLRINSPGGSVFGAQAMVAAMREYDGPITARVDALAASAASVIAAEAAQVEMAQGAMLMIHKAWSLALGNADDMRDMAGLLDKIDGQIAATYARRGGDKDWSAMMASETWFDAEEAVNIGLADRVLSESKQRGMWDLSAFKAAPWVPVEDAAPEPVAAMGDTSQKRAQRLLALRSKGI